MYSQSCNYLPNKKQSPITDNLGLTKNLGLLRNLTNNSFSKFEDSSTHLHDTFTSLTKNNDHHNFKSRTNNIMDFMYSFGDSSKLKFRNSISNLANQREKYKHCKEMASPHEIMTTMSFSSHLVGGFVGSKSQLGRRPSHGLGFKMWDMIRELVDLVGNTPPDISMTEDIFKPSLNFKISSSMYNSNGKHNRHVNLSKNDSGLVDLRNNKTKEIGKFPKQSYAEVAKTKLPVSEDRMTAISAEEHCNKINNSCSRKSSSSESMMEPPAHSRSESPNRDRITSECSVDSEDSFIVFECCEDDDASVSDDSTSSSDDESVLSAHLIEESSPSDSGCRHSGTFSFDRSCGPPVKKVRFAEGKSLAEVHPMVTWNYAYRTARRGPWEMMARDSERFRGRISRTEAILQPVLDHQHREAVFLQRFADSVS